MKPRGVLKGVQFITYAQLSKDILDFSKQFEVGKYKAIVGVPRSGLTCAHLLSVHLNAPCVQLHARQFRQSSGRELTLSNGPYLIIDDTSSTGVAMREVKYEVTGTPAEFAVVYAREAAKPFVNYWYAEHKEPDWLVITEWNWMRHQDREYIAVTDELPSMGYRLPHGFDATYAFSDRDIAKRFSDSDAAVLFTTQDCEAIANESGKPVVNARTMTQYG